MAPPEPPAPPETDTDTATATATGAPVGLGGILDRRVRPSAYRVELSLDPSTPDFAGRVEIDVNAAGGALPVDVRLNAVDLDFDRVAFRHLDGTVEPVTVGDPDAESETVTFTRPVGATGGPQVEAGTFVAEFRGKVSDQLVGVYRSRVSAAGAADDPANLVLATQFEAPHARRCFPCFDEPMFRATFEFTLEVPAGLLCVSNEAERSRELLESGRERVVFAPTRSMNPSLAAFVVGPLAATPPVTASGIAVRVVAAPDRLRLADRALDVASFALDWFLRNLGGEIMCSKLDLVALPDFAFGAMENVGCMTFREVNLLIDESEATVADLSALVQVVCHELAHLWFGDLVSIEWWDELWLKEGFASLMERRCADAYLSSLDVDVSFAADIDRAVLADLTSCARPIRNAVRTAAEAESMFDATTYEKGNAVLGMLEQAVGPDAWKVALTGLMAEHAYQPIRATHLWSALGNAAGFGGDGPSFITLAEGWFTTPGLPQVRVDVDPEPGSGFVVEGQGRRTLGRPSAAPEPAPGDWSIPLRVRGGAGERVATCAATGGRLAGVTRIPAVWDRYYLVDYSDAALDRLVAPAVGARDGRTLVSILVDLFNGVRLGSESARRWREVVDRSLKADIDLVLAEVAGRGHELAGLSGPAGKEVFEGFLAHTVTARRWDDIADPRDRAAVVTLGAGRLGLPAMVDLAELLWRRDPSPDVRVASRAALVHQGHPEAVGAALADLTASPSPQQNRQALRDLARVPDWAQFAGLLDRLGTTVRSQDVSVLLGAALGNDLLVGRVWDWIVAQWTELSALCSDMALPRILAAVQWINPPDVAARALEQVGGCPVRVGERSVQQATELLRHRSGLSLGAALFT